MHLAYIYLSQINSQQSVVDIKSVSLTENAAVPNEWLCVTVYLQTVSSYQLVLVSHE